MATRTKAKSTKTEFLADLTPQQVMLRARDALFHHIDGNPSVNTPALRELAEAPAEHWLTLAAEARNRDMLNMPNIEILLTFHHQDGPFLQDFVYVRHNGLPGVYPVQMPLVSIYSGLSREEFVQKTRKVAGSLERLAKVTALRMKELGDLCRHAKATLPHGAFEEYCREATGYSPRRCRQYMKLSKDWDRVVRYAEEMGFEPGSQTWAELDRILRWEPDPHRPPKPVKDEKEQKRLQLNQPVERPVPGWKPLDTDGMWERIKGRPLPEGWASGVKEDTYDAVEAAQGNLKRQMLSYLYQAADLAPKVLTPESRDRLEWVIAELEGKNSPSDEGLF